MKKNQIKMFSALASKTLMAALVIFSLAAQAQTQLGSDIDGEAAGDESGLSVSLSSDGKTLAIGARYNYGSDSSNIGHVRVYSLSVATAPEISLSGNSNPIDDGSSTPSTTNDTDFGTVTASKSITYTIENTGTDDPDYFFDWGFGCK